MKKILFLMFALLFVFSSCGAEIKEDVSVDSSDVFESSSRLDISVDVNETSSVSDSFDTNDNDAKTVLYFEGQYSFHWDIDGVFERYAYDDNGTTPICDYIKNNKSEDNEYFFVGICFKKYKTDVEYDEFLSRIGFVRDDNSLLLNDNYLSLDTVEQREIFFALLFPNANIEEYDVESLKFPPSFDAVGYIDSEGIQQLLNENEYIVEITWMCKESDNERWIENQRIE